MENEDNSTPEETPKETLKETVTRLEKANEEQARLIAKQEEMTAKDILGGQTNRQPEPEKPKEPTDKEYAESLTKGEIRFN